MKKFGKLLVLASLFALTGCGSNTSKVDVGGDLFSQGNSITNGDLISANIPTEKTTTVVYDSVYKAAPSKIGSSDTIIDDSYYNKGLLVTRNRYGYIGFYSMIHSDYVIAPQYMEGWVDYTITPTNYVGCLIRVRFEDETKVYDSYGNLLLENDFTSFNEKIINKTVYLTISRGYDDTIYEYNSSGDAHEVSRLPENPVVSDYDGPESGDLYKEGRYDLKQYGYENYSLYVASTGLITSYQGDSLLATFFIDLSTYSFLGIIGEKLVFQRSIAVNEEYEHYNYLSNGTKYSLETTLINFKTGAKESKDAKMVIDNVTPLKKANGMNGQYSYVTYHLINSNLILTDMVSCIVDGNFNICSDVSGASVESFLKLGNDNYYNVSTGYLYNEYLEIITSLKDANPTYYKPMKAFVGTYKGKYGIIDQDGRVVHEFVYDQIYASHVPTYNAEHVIATKEGTIYRLDIRNDYSYIVGANISVIATNIFKCDSGRYFSSDDDLVYIYDANQTQQTPYLALNEHNLIFFKYREDNNEPYRYGTFRYTDFTPSSDSSTKGREVTYATGNGVDIEHAATIELGHNKLHTVYGNDASYGVFTAGETAYYSFYAPYGVSLPSYINGNKVDQNYVTETIEDIGYSYQYTMLIKGGEDVIIKFSYSYGNQQLYHLYVAKEVGSDSRYPMLVNSANDSYSFEVPFDSKQTNEYYVKFTPSSIARYKFNLDSSSPNSITSVMTNNNETATSGIILGEHETRVYRVQLNSNVSHPTLFSINTSSATVSENFSPQNPYELSYGMGSSYTFEPPTASARAYLRFYSRFGGTYSINLNFNYSYGPESVAYYKYDKNGLRTEISSLSNVTLDMGGYVLIMLTPVVIDNTASNIILTSYQVSSDSGRSYHNPSSFTSGYVNNSSSYPLYYRYYNSTDNSKHYVYTVTNDTELCTMSDTAGIETIGIGSKDMYLSGLSGIVFRLGPNCTIESQSMEEVITNPTTIYSSSYDDSISSNNYRFYKYYYESGETTPLSITIQGDSTPICYRYVVNKDTLPAGDYSYSYSSSVSLHPSNMEYGDYICFVIYNTNYYTGNYHITFNY